ncbi:DUF1127 domain-containing protein [Halopseudomonas oceani]|uniref:DUF1127 domain-containing protein n=1 Tax=Halopseudomonas oceani TaxID=1708783 RepID=UPI0038996023
MFTYSVANSRVGRLAGRAWRLVGRWRRWRYERSLLAAMTGAELKDVGISRADAHEELRRSFWSRRP